MRLIHQELRDAGLGQRKPIERKRLVIAGIVASLAHTQRIPGINRRIALQLDVGGLHLALAHTTP